MLLLVDTLARLDLGDGWFRFVAGEPAGSGWVPFDELVATPAMVGGWLDELAAGEAKGHHDVAASYLAAWVAGAVADPVTAALSLQGRAWPTRPWNLAVHRHADGWFDGLAVRRSTVAVLLEDPHADDPDATVVADAGVLAARLAQQLIDVLSPIFAAIRAYASYGTRGMWGSVADGIAADALQRARHCGGDADAAWRHANGFIDLLVDRMPALKVRPGFADVEWSGGHARFAVRGTCCLYYKVSGHELDPCGEAYCTSCPFRDDADRRRRWAAWLDEQAAESKAAVR